MSAPVVHIVDDDASLRQALARLLGAAGYQAIQYDCPRAFLDAARGTLAPGCILLDLNMPALNGVQLQEELARIECALPIVFMTAHGDIATSVRAIKAGAEDFLTKPMDKETLLDALQRAMRRYWAAHAEQSDLRALRRRLDSLTAREREVFDLVLGGLLNKQIAGQLGNTERTVKAHRHAVMEKMGVKSVAELAAIGARLGVAGRRADG